MSTEQPQYTVLHTEGSIEYRQYEPYLVAETVIEGASNSQAAGNEGFRRLFRYITGANSASGKIAMTAPVQQGTTGEKIAMTSPVQQTESTAGYRVAFMLPSQYTLATAPRPSDSRVAVREVPGRIMAVLRYSGRWTERNLERRSAELMQAIETASVSAVAEMESAMYNPPYMPPFLRRNEVMVEVNRVPAATPEKLAAGQVAY